MPTKLPIKKKKWTVMVYLAGDNNLDKNGAEDLKEMKKVGSTADVHVVAQFDRAGTRRTTNRYYLKKGTSLAADAVLPLKEVNTGDPAALTDFIQWGVKNYPADRYMLVLWNHGQGWDDTDIYKGERGISARLPRQQRVRHAFFRTSVQHAVRFSAAGGLAARAILLDDNAKDFLDNIEMKQVVMAAEKIIGGKLDILGMDACLMSMAEVAYQITGGVSYAVGSEQTEPLDGWPYDTILNNLSKKPDMNAEELSKLIVKIYIASYKGSSEAVTLSASNLAFSSAMVSAVKALALALKSGMSDTKTLVAISTARNRAQEYDVQENVDLVDLCQLLGASAVSGTIKNACTRVINAVQGQKGFVMTSGYIGAPVKQSHGVAIYFPTRDISPLYAGLDFVKATGWDVFLKAYIKNTRSRKNVM